MSDFDRLEDKLTKLRQRERVAGEGRRLRGGSPEALLGSVVTEIDETILPRRLSFSVEGGVTIHLAVANRRLQALVSPAPDLRGIDMGPLADTPLPDEEEPAVGGVKDALLAAFASGAAVSIRSQRPPGRGYPSDVGVPSAVLARVWSVTGTTPDDPRPEDLLSRYLSDLGDDAVAWLRIEGEAVTDQGGDAAVVETLGEQAAIFLDGYFGKFDHLYPEETGACATLVGPMGEQGLAALFVEIGDVSAFIMARANRGPELATRWQRLTAT